MACRGLSAWDLGVLLYLHARVPGTNKRTPEIAKWKTEGRLLIPTMLSSQHCSCGHTAAVGGASLHALVQVSAICYLYIRGTTLPGRQAIRSESTLSMSTPDVPVILLAALVRQLILPAWFARLALATRRIASRTSEPVHRLG